MEVDEKQELQYPQVTLWVMARRSDNFYLLSPVGDWEAVQQHERPLGVGVRPGCNRFGVMLNLHSVLSRVSYEPYDAVPPEKTDQWLREYIRMDENNYQEMMNFVRRIQAERQKYGNYPKRSFGAGGDLDDEGDDETEEDDDSDEE